MLIREEKIKRELLRKIQEISIFGATFSISFTLLDAIFFNDIYIFFAYLFCVIIYGSFLLNYYFTFKREIFPIKYSLLNFLCTALIALSLLTYVAGGFGGAMISAFYALMIVSGLLLEKKQAVKFSLMIIIIYLIFFFGETFNVIIPIVMQPRIIRYSKAIIDVLCFSISIYFLTIISQHAQNSISFFKLRSIRLSKIRKRLEFLVKRRTRELEQSNRKLRKAQKQIKKSYKELKKLDVEKDRFISIAAHELKTPLTTISGYSQLLKNNRIIRNPQKRKMFLGIVDSESRRLSQLVSEMLDLSRIDIGVIRYNIEEVDIYEFLNTINSKFFHKIKEKNLNFEIKGEKNLPKIIIDKDKLYQIIENLVSNAIKYTIKGKISIKVNRKREYMQFSVVDTGIGIAKKYHKRIFERFFQVDSSLSREAEGTGLGLSIVKEYVERLGGKIWLKSKLGKGTTFYVKLPIKTKLKIDNEKVKFVEVA